MVQDKNRNLQTELGRHPLAEGELREIKEAVFVSLNQSQPEGYRIRVLSQFGRTNALLFQESGLTFHLIRSLRRETDRFLPRPLGNVFQFFVDMRLIYPLGSFRKSISSEHSFNHHGVMPTGS